MSDETVYVEVTVMHNADHLDAVLVSQDPESEETNVAKWVPKSQITDVTGGGELDIGEEVEIEIPVWLAEEKGLV